MVGVLRCGADEADHRQLAALESGDAARIVSPLHVVIDCELGRIALEGRPVLWRWAHRTVTVRADVVAAVVVSADGFSGLGIDGHRGHRFGCLGWSVVPRVREVLVRGWAGTADCRTVTGGPQQGQRLQRDEHPQRDGGDDEHADPISVVPGSVRVAHCPDEGPQTHDRQDGACDPQQRGDDGAHEEVHPATDEQLESERGTGQQGEALPSRARSRLDSHPLQL